MKERKMRIAVYNLQCTVQKMYVIACNDHIKTEL